MAIEKLLGELPEGWMYSSLGDVCTDAGGDVQTGPFGSQLHAKDYVASGVPSIMPQNIGDNRIIEAGIARITKADAQRLSRYLVRKGDIIYSRRGDVERRALIGEREDGWLCGTGCLRVRLGSGGVDPRYASFYLGHPNVRDWIVRHAHGATMANLNTSILSACPLVVPPKAIQLTIASILGSLDDKIELNRKMNETLEAMARAVFKSWFVDFDPVRAKIEGRQPFGMDNPTAQLFPSTLDDSPVGRIPSGWRTCVLDDIVQWTLGGDWGIDSPTDSHPIRVRCIRGADIPELQAGSASKMPSRYIRTTSLDKRKLAGGDIVIEVSGGSPTQSTGRAVLISDKLLSQLDSPLVCSNFCRLLKLRVPAYSKYIYYWLRAVYENDEFLQFENGTTGIKNLALTNFSASYMMCLPSEQVTSAFNTMVSPFLERALAGTVESATLAALRDTLLPKLLSGKLRIPQAEEIVEAAL